MNCTKLMTIGSSCIFECLAFYELGYVNALTDPFGLYMLSITGGNALMVDNATPFIDKLTRLEGGAVTSDIKTIRDSEDVLITCSCGGGTTVSTALMAPFFVVTDVGKNLYWKLTGETSVINGFIDDHTVTIAAAGPVAAQYVQVLLGYADVHRPLIVAGINSAGDLSVVGKDGTLAANDISALYPKILNGTAKKILTDPLASAVQVMESGLWFEAPDQIYDPLSDTTSSVGSGFFGLTPSRDSNFIIELFGFPFRVYEIDTTTLWSLVLPPPAAAYVPVNVSGEGVCAVYDSFSTTPLHSYVADIDGNTFEITTSLGESPIALDLTYVNGNTGIVVGDIKYSILGNINGPSYADPYNSITDMIPILDSNGNPGTGIRARAIDTNALGWIIGIHDDGSGNDVPFLFRNGVTHNLNDLLPPGFGDWQLLFPYSLSDDGYVMGRGTKSGSPRDFVMHFAPC